MRPTLIAFLVLLVPTLASADVVGPDPTDCPVGSQGTSCHGMEYCRPRTCAATTDCAAGEVCQSRDLCITSGSCGGGFIDPDAGPPPPVPVVTASCSGSCAEGTCEPTMVCVPEGSPPPTGGGDGCGCRVTGPGSPLLGLGALALLGALLVARRR